jgi:ATP-binding cassette, subfamily B, heavy metal transporter
MEERNWKAPASMRGYLREIAGTAKTVVDTLRLCHSKEARKWIGQKYLGILVNITLGMCLPKAIALIFDGVSRHDESRTILGLGLMALVLWGQKGLVWSFWRAHEYLFGIANLNLHTSILRSFFEKSVGQHKHLRGLNHESIVKGKHRAYELYDNHLRELFEVVTGILVAYLFILWSSPFAGIVLGIAMAFHALGTLWVNYRLLSEATPIERDFTRFDRYYAELLRLFPRIYVSGKRGEELARMRERWSGLAERDRRAYYKHSIRVTLQDSVMVGAIVFALYNLAMWASRGEWGSVATLYPIFAWSTQISGDLARLRGIERNIYKCIPSIAIMCETLSTPPDVSERGWRKLSGTEPLSLEFRDVSYAYPGGDETLSKVSFTVAPGKKVALIGPTGAGKSTTEYLPLRFMEATDGAVLVGGYDVRELDTESLLCAIGYVPQKPLIFDGTVRENLLYSLPREERESWPDSRLSELMELLSIDFGKRPAGENPLDIVVGRDGVELSGGQAQRLAIGAVVIKRPRLLIVDEATSALDSATETELLEGLRQWIDGAGMLVIAHRLSTVRDADTIVVLEGGKVEAIGHSFAELVESSRTFRRLVSGQDHLLR